MKCCGPQYDLDPITRRKRTSRLSIGPYRRHELLTGWIVYPVEGYTGYGDGTMMAPQWFRRLYCRLVSCRTAILYPALPSGAAFLRSIRAAMTASSSSHAIN